MEFRKIAQSDKAKIAILAVVAIVAVSGLGRTVTGQRLIAHIGISDTFAQTSDAAGQMAQKTNNAVQAFLGRSPGARGATDMLKGKARVEIAEKVKASDGTTPTQRALGKMFDEPLQSLAGPMAPATSVEFLPVDAASTLAALPDVGSFSPIGSGFFSPVSGGGFSGGGGVGGSGPTGDVTLPPDAPVLPPIATAVPEPSTWMLLLIGFAAVGASIRRTHARNNFEPKRAGNCATAF